MKKTLYYSSKQEAVAPAIITLIMGFIGYLFMINSFRGISYIFNAFTAFFLFVSSYFLLKPNKKYILCDESGISIYFDKKQIHIPHSFIVVADLIDSPITHKKWTHLGPKVEIGEIRKIVRLTLNDNAVSDMQVTASQIKNGSFPSQIVFIGGDYKELFILKPPGGGFQGFLDALSKYAN